MDHLLHGTWVSVGDDRFDHVSRTAMARKMRIGDLASNESRSFLDERTNPNDASNTGFASASLVANRVIRLAGSNF